MNKDGLNIVIWSLKSSKMDGTNMTFMGEMWYGGLKQSVGGAAV